MRRWVLLFALTACGRLGFDELGGFGDDGPPPLPRVAVFTGGRSTCSIVDGLVSCWGDGRFGQLGDGAEVPRAAPVRVPALDGAISFDLSEHHGCAVRADGKVWCWGANPDLELGDEDPDRKAPTTTVSLPRAAVQVDVGDYHSCALLENGDVYCWGKNYLGQLGYGIVSQETKLPTRALIDNAVEIGAGQWTTCARKANGEVWCWGENSSGQVGIGSSAESIGTPTRVPGLVASRISVGEGAVCALENGRYRCWGGYRQLGQEDVIDSSLPQPPSALAGLVSIGVGDTGACATAADGTAYCWGTDLYGLLGNGAPFVDQFTPQLVTGSGLANVSVGYDHACATQGNDIRCWGRGSYGQLGDGRDLGTTPKKIPLAGMTEVDVGLGFACARSASKVFCWGADEHAQLADGGGDPQPMPVEVPVSTPIGSLSVGANHACIRTASSALECWGANYSGQLGMGDSAFKPGVVSPPVTAQQVSAGDDFTCATNPNGQVLCWGTNGDGQLGDGTRDDKTSPLLAGSLIGIVGLDADGGHTCAYDATQAWCWGRNYDGELGLGDSLPHYSPSLLTGQTFRSMSAGFAHTCGLRTTSAVACWGGFLGGGNERPQDLGVQGIRVVAGGGTTCVVDSTEHLACGGDNEHGQLGDGAFSFTPSLREIPEVGTVRSVAASFDLACAVTNAGGEVWCWGNNDRGQLGRGTMTSSPAPVLVTR